MYSTWAVRIGPLRFRVTPRHVLHPIEGRRRRREDRLRELGPDGAEEHLFRSLDEVDAELAGRLRAAYLDALGEPVPDDPVRIVELRIAPDEEGGRRLRITSRFSGTTRWLYEWEGDEAEALAFVRDAADLDREP